MKYVFDSSVFIDINSEEKAYWLGFITGDGSIDKYSLRIELSNKDFNHLVKFKNFMKSDYLIKPTRKNCSNISINSIDFVQSLHKYNIVENKTYKNLGTPNINKNLLVHYYRGLLDSDGWVTQVKQNNKYRGGIGFSSHSIKILTEIKDFIKIYFPQLRSKVNTYHRKNNTWQVSQLQIGGMKLFIDLYNFFYKDAIIYLDRKKSLGEEVCLNILTNPKDKRLKENKSKLT